MSDFRPVDLRCEFLVEPLAVAESHPRFSWRYPSGPKDWRQKKFRIQVASALDQLGQPDYSEFGRENSSCLDIRYEGEPIPPTEDAYWRVKAWGSDGVETPWSAPSHFARALAGPMQWYGAKWMTQPEIRDWTQSGPSPTFRREFELPANPIKKARLHFSAKGLIVPYLNGSRASDIVFSPGWTDYRRRFQYDVEDVANRLHAGRNVLAAELGDGWFCGSVCWFGRNQYGERPAALMRLCVEFEDREPILIVSGDEGWRCFEGRIRSNDLIHGESQDYRFDPVDWLEPGFNDTKWASPAVSSLGQSILVPRMSEPVRRTEVIPAKEVLSIEGKYLVDFGQNIAGRVRIKTKASSELIEIRHGEILDSEGKLYTENLRAAKATDRYDNVAANSVLEPEFTFHGFRYAEIYGLDDLKSEDCEAVVLHNDLRRTGWFECSNPLLNKLFNNTVWSMRGNFLEVPTDCPQRDERLGWTGDAQVFCRTACHLFDVSSFLRKWLRDVRDAVGDSGRFSNVAPQLQELGEGAPGWGEAGILVPFEWFDFYESNDILEENIRAMRAHLGAILEANPDGLWRHERSHDFGDWLAPFEETDKTFLASAFFIQCLKLFSEYDGREGEFFEALWWESMQEFRKTYFQNGALTVDTQTAHALAIAFELLKPEELPGLASRLDQLIQESGGRLGTGFLGVNHLLPSLAQFGYFDRCYDLLLREDYPSWLYSVTKGATTIWERWDGWTEDRGFQDVGMNSFNHYAYGSVVQWFFENIGGIQPIAPGFQQFRLCPTPGGNLEYAKVRFDSRYGTIRSEWKHISNGFKWEIEIPPNTSAQVLLPPIVAKSWTLNGQKFKNGSMDIFGSRRRSIQLGSGTYLFIA